MTNRAPRSAGNHQRRQWLTPSVVIAGAALFIALGSSAVAANSLIHRGDIAAGAVTSKAIRDGGVMPRDLNGTIQGLLGGQGIAGVKGDTGLTGTPGVNGANGPNGPNGANGVDGTDGTNGTNGTNGINGTIMPLWATRGTTDLPTGTDPTVVVDRAVPAGNYVVLAKTQASHTGAGDSVNCLLKAGGSTIDQSAMKTLPALAAIPISLQAVFTAASPTTLSVECTVTTAGGTAKSSSLIAIPTG